MFASFHRHLIEILHSAQGWLTATVVRRLRRENSGNVAMMFALLVIPLTGAIGLAIDMGRTYHVAMHTQGALDAAALAAGRTAQIEKTDTLNKASKSASAYFDQAKPTDVVEAKIAFAPNSQQTEFTVTATSWVKTPFLSVLDFLVHRGAEGDAPQACKDSYYACTKVTSTATAQICLNCSDVGAGNSDDGTNLEISMMLDLTGSMGGDKIVDLQAAAKDLIDIVVWGDQSKYTSKVALAPFAPAVNVGDYFTKITGKSDREDNDNNSNRNIHYPANCLNGNGSVKNECSNKDGLKKYNKLVYIAKYAKCVVERSGSTDETPKDGTWLPAWNVIKEGTSSEMTTTCNPNTAVVPLTSDRTKLKDTIDGFTVSGSTAGHLGTAFAWYLLSPNWSDVWPETSTPTPYGTQKVKKIAILMTDGEYNTVLGTNYGDGSAKATEALTKATTLCTAMKKSLLPDDPNIEIYTVGFKLDTTASKNMLRNCATNPDHYYETSSGDGLKAAFRDIALKISRLRLTN